MSDYGERLASLVGKAIAEADGFTGYRIGQEPHFERLGRAALLTLCREAREDMPREMKLAPNSIEIECEGQVYHVTGYEAEDIFIAMLDQLAREVGKEEG